MNMSLLPTFIDPELWAAFMESRRAMKVPFTPLAQKLVIRKLLKMHAEGWDVNASLEKSAIYGYRGVFEVEKIDKTPAVDPVLEKLKHDESRSVPMPPEIKSRFESLVKQITAQ